MASEDEDDDIFDNRCRYPSDDITTEKARRSVEAIFVGWLFLIHLVIALLVSLICHRTIELICYK